MALVVPDVGEVLMLKRALNHTAADNVKVHLFVNDVTPSDDTVLGDLTECTADGYAAEVLTGTSFTIATNTGTTTAEYAQITFELTGTATVYGYYVTDNAGTGLLWVERFADAPHNFPSGGGNESITIKIQAA